MKILKNYIQKREKYLAFLNDNRTVRPFEWGVEFVKDFACCDGDLEEPLEFFRKFANEVISSSDAFFHLPEISDYEVRGEVVKWTSAVETTSQENNTVYARFFPYAKNKKGAVVVLPHWNAKAGSYFDLCRVFNKVGLSALRLTLPYHEERMPPELQRADYLVSPNIGRTIQSVRQAVLDTKAAVRWLHLQGYEKIGIVGTSIGSCVAFLAFVHEPLIQAGVFNHVSGYFADVVWRGISTYHVRAGFADKITLEDLRECWIPISPIVYIDKLTETLRPQRYIYTLYDLSFPVDLSKQLMKILREKGIKHSEVCLPCGHYTLGEKPWVYLDGWKIVSFLRKHLLKND
ncbi:MAG: abhydrolase domain-containing 18 [Acidobacteria bacterium]|jgi:hypothetical protein|nr:MAG: abhydrolase domain-containing 18 [Acidobacteriota bacterium]GIU82480.1 MAG: alpha/beta hydrolase [Pyrinomonadaceae bacterium]